MADQSVAGPLTADEATMLVECEGAIARAREAVLEVACAFLMVRMQRLYRDRYATFEEYADERLEMLRGKTSEEYADGFREGFDACCEGIALRANILFCHQESMGRDSPADSEYEN